MQIEAMPAQRRTQKGTRYCRRLRDEGKLPAIIYGHKEEPMPIALEAHDLKLALQHHSRVIEVDMEGSASRYLIKSIQYDHLGTTPIHVDLMRVYADERVQVKVEVELKGMPKGAHDGGVLTQHITELEVECPVTEIPEVFRHSVVDLGIGDSLLVKHIVLPEGVTLLADPDDKLATVRVPTAVEEEETVEAEEGAEATAEPEVIGRSKEESEEE